MCYDVQILQQILDKSFEGDIKKAMMHIESCPQCKKAFESLKLEESEVVDLLDFGIDMPPPNLARQLMMARVQNEALIDSENSKNKDYMGVFKLNKGLKRFSAALAGVVLCTGIFLSEPLKVKAQELLQMFRMENVQTISFSHSDIYELEQLMEKGKGSTEIANFGKVDFDSEIEPISIENVSSPQDIKSVMPTAKVVNPSNGFNITNASVTNDINIKFTLDVAKINDFLKYMGEKNLLPESIGNKPFFVRTGSFLNYGLEMKPDGSSSSHDNAYIGITQTEAPEIELPSDVDKKELVDSMLSLSLVPKNLKSQLLAIEDLTTTMPVLYSEDEEKAQELSIRGQKAILITSKDSDDDYMRICFKEDGFLFFIDSYGVDKDTVLDLIEDME